MREYELLLACYRSGQISERQWQEHLRDEVFRAWVKALTLPKLPIPCLPCATPKRNK